MFEHLDDPDGIDPGAARARRCAQAGGGHAQPTAVDAARRDSAGGPRGVPRTVRHPAGATTTSVNYRPTSSTFRRDHCHWARPCRPRRCSASTSPVRTTASPSLSTAATCCSRPRVTAGRHGRSATTICCRPGWPTMPGFRASSSSSDPTDTSGELGNEAGAPLWITHDDGSTWRRASLGPDVVDVSAIGLDVWALVRNCPRTGPSGTSATCSIIVEESLDGGSTWRAAPLDATGVGFDATSLDASKGSEVPPPELARISDDRAYILAAAPGVGGLTTWRLLFTDDAAATWSVRSVPCAGAFAARGRGRGVEHRGRLAALRRAGHRRIAIEAALPLGGRRPHVAAQGLGDRARDAGAGVRPDRPVAPGRVRGAVLHRAPQPGRPELDARLGSSGREPICSRRRTVGRRGCRCRACRPPASPAAGWATSRS